MARNLLNDADVKAATVPEGKRVAKLFDGEGLELWATPVKPKRGRPRKDAPKLIRRWRFSYRFAGKRNSVSLGAYPTVSLADARKKAEELRRQLTDGKDPSAQRKAQKQARAVAHATTFAAVADEWLEKQKALSGDARRSESTLGKLAWLLSLVGPHLGHQQIGEITPMQCLATLKKVEARGRHGRTRNETARRCRETMSRVFRMAVATGRAQFDPTASLIGDDVLTPPARNSYTAITEPTAFGRLLRDIDAYHGAPETRLALQLIALTALRPGELRQLRWSWIDLDSTEPVVTLPAEIMKMRREHRIPLSRQAVAILAELRELTGWGEFVFPCAQPRRTVGRDGQPSKRPSLRPMSEGALNSALKRLGYASEIHVPHGFRSSFSTMANEAGIWDPDTIEAALAHQDKNQIRAIYNRASYWDARRKLAQWWADRCGEMREERSPKVVALRPAAS
jgi:integrase